jgi:hypothetical protein
VRVCACIYFVIYMFVKFGPGIYALVLHQVFWGFKVRDFDLPKSQRARPLYPPPYGLEAWLALAFLLQAHLQTQNVVPF